MQALTALRPGGLLPLPSSRRLSRSRRANLAVTAAKNKAPPAEAPPAAAPAPPSDIPAYFQPAPVQQQGQGGQPQMYQAVPQYSAVPPPAAQPSFWSNIPPLVYIGAGVVLAGLLGKVMAIIKGGPQKMQEMAMQQMMQQMMKQMGGAPGGASPFGAAGANPFGGAGGANPFGAPGANPFGAAGGNPFGAGSPFGAPPTPAAGSGFPSMQPAYDTTATPAQPAAAAAAAAAGTAAPAPDSTTTAAGGDSKPKKKSAFVDVNAGDKASGSSNGNGNGSKEGAEAGAGSSSSSMPPPPFNMPPGGMPPPPFSMPPGGMPNFGAGMPGAGAPTGAGGVANTMLDMLKNPEMQKMLYPYLPEPMRNQETFEWMLSNPEYRQQLEGMLQQQATSAGSPAVEEMMKGMDMSPEKMQAQFDAMGMTPDQFITKVMADPDLASMMTNPKVMTAIAECTKNPMAIFNYQNDPEVLRTFEKMSALFPQAAGAGALPTMPPGFGQPPQQ